MAVFTFGCTDAGPPAGVVGHVRAYFGGVAADEPEAVLIARDVLSAGGSAADAVVSMGLALMVTRPDAAGPGGGGMCVVFDAKSGKGEAIEFLSRAASARAPTGRWVASAPGSFRGLFALQSRYGQLRWEQLVLPAERMARFGVRMPRALAKVLAGPAKTALKGRRSRAIFFDVAGKPLKEGDVLRQVDLAATLGRIRIAGPGDFYSGPLARNFTDGVRAAGGWLPIEDLRAYRPKWVKAKKGKSGPHDVYFLPTPAAGGEVAAEIWNKLGNKSGFSTLFKKAHENRMAINVVAAARQGYKTVLTSPGINTATNSVGALAIDRMGNSAACVFTMGSPFGSGRIAGDTGVTPAKPARAESLLALSAMIVGNRNTNQTFMASTGAGDQFTSSAMMGVVLRILEGEEKVEAALAAARSAAAAEQVGVLVEPKLPLAEKQALGEMSGRVRELPRIGQVNIMWCPDGVAYLPERCVVHTDPRGYGHAINAEF
jgi:gamma-glutamyltranspeptidase/glutathione hydrolase